jgi:hypothetical protein
MPAGNRERRSKFFAFLSRLHSSDSTDVPPQKDRRGTHQKHRGAHSFSGRDKPLSLEEHDPISKFSISSPILRSPISLTGFDNDVIDSLASSGAVDVHNSGRRAGFTASPTSKFERPYHSCGSSASFQSSKSAVARAGSRMYHLPTLRSYSSHEQQSDAPGSPYQNQGFAASGTTLSSNSRPQTPYDDLDDYELPLTTVPEFGEIGIAIGSEEELDGVVNSGDLPDELEAQYLRLYASQRSEPPRRPTSSSERSTLIIHYII